MCIRDRYKTFFENGKIETYGQYRRDKKVGEWKEFNENGKKLLTILWKDGKGKYTEYYDKWNISKSGILNSKENEIGFWKSFDKNGKLTDSLFYKDGLLDETSYIFNEGYDCFQFYELGEFLHSFCLNFKGDTISKMIKVGDLDLNTSYYENGKIKLLGYFDDKTNLPVNTWKVFNIEGCLLYTSPSPRDATLSRMPSSA